MKKRLIKKVEKLDVEIFERKLQAMAKERMFDAAMEESFEKLLDEAKAADLSGDELLRFYQTVKKASHEHAIMEARGQITKTKLPFGRYLQLIRDKSGLSQSDVAKLLNKDPSYVERIENGLINPLKLRANDVADIMQLFRFTLTELKTSITAFLSLSAVKKSRTGTAMARSCIKAGTKERGDSISHAMDAALQAIAKKTSKAQPEEEKLDSNYLDAITSVLQERGEKDLLE